MNESVGGVKDKKITLSQGKRAARLGVGVDVDVDVEVEVDVAVGLGVGIGMKGSIGRGGC